MKSRDGEEEGEGKWLFLTRNSHFLSDRNGSSDMKMGNVPLKYD